MTFLLDTDICIYILNESSPKLRAHLEAMEPKNIVVSALTEAELLYGALHSGNPKKNQERVKRFLPPFLTLPFDSDAAVQFAQIKELLVKKGRLIGAIDMLIAAIAKSHDLTIVTNNLRHFEEVPDLKVENWGS